MAEAAREEVDERTGNFSSLPADTVWEIYRRFLAMDPGAAGIMGSVCKSWRDTVLHGGIDIVGGSCLPEKRRRVTELNCVAQLDSVANHHSHVPLLMTLNRRDGTCVFSHPFHPFTLHAGWTDLVNATIRYSAGGWLLLTRRHVDDEGTNVIDSTTFFFNPVTAEIIELPRSIVGPNGQQQAVVPRSTVSMCFTSPPTSPDCCVIAAGAFPDLAIFIWKQGRDYWEVYKHLGETGERECFPIAGSANPVVVGRRYCCCLATDGRVAIFDLDKQSFSLHESPQLNGLKRSFLLEDNGKLLAVFEPVPGGEEQSRRRIYTMTMKIGGEEDGSSSWEPVVDYGERLGGKMLFVSNCAGSFTKPAKVRSAGNKIYFPTSRNIYYSLATKKYHCFHPFLGPQFSTSCLLGLKEYPSNACWIEAVGIVSLSESCVDDEVETDLVSLS